MAKSPILFLLGLAVGAGVMFLALQGRGNDDVAKAGTLESRVRDLQAEIENLVLHRDTLVVKLQEREREQSRVEAESRELAARVAELEAGEPAPVVPAPVEPVPVEPAEPPTEKELLAGVMAFGSSLQAVILGEGGDEAVAKLKDLFARAGPEGVQSLIDKFEGSELGMGPKTVLAHAFAQSGDPLALKALEDTLKDPDRGLIDHRVAAHGLAFTDLESVVPTLRRTAKEDPDQGARANAAFGLARRGDAEGMELYAAATDDAFQKRDPAAIQYLSGFALLGEKAVPVMRERLTTYEDKQAKIVLIELLKDQKDVESVPALRKLAAAPETDPDVRKAAEQALTELAK